MRALPAARGARKSSIRGQPPIAFVFVGEAPGANEDMQARPLSDEGELLNKIIEAIGLKRETS